MEEKNGILDRIIEHAKSSGKRVSIYSHERPDGDAVGSSCALVEYLKLNGIDAQYVITKPLSFARKQTVGHVPVVRSDENSARSEDITVILDTSTLEHLENKLFEGAEKENIYVVDHHSIDDNKASIEQAMNLPAENVYRKASASATCEVLAQEMMSSQISGDIPNFLLSGILSDTACLRFAQDETLKTVISLMNLGADYYQMSAPYKQKPRLRDEVVFSKLLADPEIFKIGESFGMIVSLGYSVISSMPGNYKDIQKKVARMSDIEGCGFCAILAENEPGKIFAEFRSGYPLNFDVLDLATTYGGGGRRNASGCTFLGADGYDIHSATDAVRAYAESRYSSQAVNIPSIELNEADEELKQILRETDSLKRNVTTSILTRVQELKDQGAHYDFLIRNLKPLKQYLLEQEVIGEITQYKGELRNGEATGRALVNLRLSPRKIKLLQAQYNATDDEILGTITAFSNINIKRASIQLPNGKKATIHYDGSITKENLDSYNR